MPKKKSPEKNITSASARAPRVLIVEDDEPTLDALVVKLADMNIPVATAPDGEEAAKKILKQKWDVIVIDILLPKKNGFTLLKEIQHDPRHAHATILVMSNLSGTEHQKHAMDLGAHEFIEKTKVSLSDIAEKIARALDAKNS